MARHLLAMSLFWVAAPALAQPECHRGEGREDEARGLFQAGSAAGQAGRWEDAAEYFEQAYVLSCAPSALYNHGVALAERGRFRQALDVFEALSRLDALEPDVAEAARAGLEDARAHVGVIVALAGAGRILLDGVYVGEGGRPIELTVDPGMHSLQLVTEHGEGVWTGFVEARTRREVSLSPAAPRAPAPAEAAPIPIAPIALVAAAGALAIAGAITGGIALGESETLHGMCEGGVCPVGARARADEVLALSITTDVLLGTAALVGGAGLVWLAISLSEDDSDASASLRCAGTACEGTVWW